jgi:hypothetical protein
LFAAGVIPKADEWVGATLAVERKHDIGWGQPCDGLKNTRGKDLIMYDNKLCNVAYKIVTYNQE